MAVLLAIVQLPLALGGEAAGGENVGLGVLSVASIALGWVALFALWWFVFRNKERGKRKKDPPS